MTRNECRDMILEQIRRTEMGYCERFEHDAERFYRETGLLAPGKSVPAEMWTEDIDHRRHTEWDAFQHKLRHEWIELMRDAATFLK